MLNKVTVDASDPALFNKAYIPYLKCYSRTQIIFGGASSGKSKFIAQRCVADVLDGHRNYLVCRQVARTMKTSVFAEICRVIEEWGVTQFFNINKSDYIINCVNGYQIVFIGLDDVEKIKSIVPAKDAWTDLWLEEATECDKASVKQLFRRQRGGNENVPKRMTLTFNPILQNHWIFEEYFKTIGWADNQTEYHGDGLSILKTIYKDNRFLTSDDMAGLENEKDKYFRDVYTLGNWGILGHVIFTNWRVADLSDAASEDYLPDAQRTNHRNGLDFGYSSDPAALWVSHYDKAHKTIYVYDELYETGLTNDVLAERIKAKIGSQMVTCDSAEPKSIAELQMHGVSAWPAIKGKDSVLFGIQWLQQQTMVVDTKCINVQNELRQFHWKEDAGGHQLPIPVDRNNHFIDAGRYGYEGDMIPPPEEDQVVELADRVQISAF